MPRSKRFDTMRPPSKSDRPEDRFDTMAPEGNPDAVDGGERPVRQDRSERETTEQGSDSKPDV
ncbi:MAG TPA: hypothetical protein VF094_05920 [Gaiellaceae bacterium]